MSNNRSKPKTDPVIAKLSERASGEGVAELQGYVGPSEDEVIRLYGSREMISYVDIPMTAVLHIVEPENENEPTVIYTLSSTEVRFTSVRSAKLPADQIPAIAGSQGSFGLGQRGIVITDNYPAAEVPAILHSRALFGLGQRGIIVIRG